MALHSFYTNSICLERYGPWAHATSNKAIRRMMSALAHKRTCAVQKLNVRFGPKADIATYYSITSLTRACTAGGNVKPLALAEVIAFHSAIQTAGPKLLVGSTGNIFPNCRLSIAPSSLYGDPSIRCLSKGSSRMLRQMGAAFC